MRLPDPETKEIHLATGTRVLNGRYELGDLIGRGGMADVYRGTDLRLGRDVAVKILRADLARDPQFLARFRREAQAVAGLNHVSIVSVYDSGEESQGEGQDQLRSPYIVMEMVEGHTLKDLLKAGPLPAEQAVEYALGVLAALEYSHKAGIVHRDIKPGNVMVVGDSGQVKVMDFGIARAVSDSSATMTQTQAVVGTAQYLSPEQALGETVDSRSDLYSAGCLLYELLTGRPPFQGDSAVSVAYQHVQGIASPPSKLNTEVSAALDSVVAKALRKNREDRFQDAAAFRRALRAARGGVPVHDVAVPVGADATEAMAMTPAEAGAETPANPPTEALALDDDGPLTLTHDQLRVLLPEIRNLPEVQQAQRKRRHRRGLMVVVWIFVVMALAGAGFALYLWLTRPVPPEMVTVPSVAHKSEAEAIQTLYNLHLQTRSESMASATEPKGKIVKTDPAEGQRVTANSTVTLFVSTGPSAITIPAEIVGQTEAAAYAMLSKAGLTAYPTTHVANDPKVPAGMVITTNPAPGQTVSVDGPLEIVVSTGKVEVPDLAGQTVEQATAALKALGLSVTIVQAENSVVAPGLVTAQNPASKGTVEQGGTVTLTIAKAPAPTPTPTPTPSTSSSPPPKGGGNGQ